MNNYIKKIYASTLLLLIITATVGASGFTIKYTQLNESNINTHNSPLNSGGGWPQIYNDGAEDQAYDITVDSQNNIIVTGYSYSGTRADAYTIKYDRNGNEIWHAAYNSGSNDVAFAITIDKYDNLYIFGYTGVMPIEKGNCFIVKYSPDGIEQWIHEIHLEECNFPGGIAIDQDDNIIITGGSGIWSMNIYYWVIKMNNIGIEQWNHTFHESAIDLGLTIDVDYENNIVVSGFSSTPFVDNVFIIKYSENGKKLWEKRREGNQPWEVAIDSQNNIIVVGTGYIGWKITMLTIKNDKDGNLLWTREFDSGGEVDGAYCVDVDSNDNIFVSGLSSFSKYDYYEHCTIIYNPEGNEICVKRPGIEGFIHGIAIDSTDNVIVTGTIFEGINGYYTTKYNDIAPPEIQLKKPKDHHLHIFNIPLIKLKKCTIVIGKLIVLLDSSSPSNIDCIEIYLDDILKTKLYDPPFEWTWSEKTFGKHKLNIMIYDDTGSAERFEISFWQLI